MPLRGACSPRALKRVLTETVDVAEDTEDWAITICRRANTNSSEFVYTGKMGRGLQPCETVQLTKHISGYRRDRRRHWSAPSSSYHGTWRVFRRGRLSQDIFEGAQNFATVLRDLGKDQRWSSHRQLEIWVTEPAEGHQVFATPPCPVQRHLAIVVAAEVTPWIISGTFSVKEKLCARLLQRFRVICSHLKRDANVCGGLGILSFVGDILHST